MSSTGKSAGLQLVEQDPCPAGDSEKIRSVILPQINKITVQVVYKFMEHNILQQEWSRILLSTPHIDNAHATGLPPDRV